jgi:hypothetical protein
VCEPQDALACPKGFVKRCSKGESAVFCRVVVVDLEILQKRLMKIDEG